MFNTTHRLGRIDRATWLYAFLMTALTVAVVIPWVTTTLIPAMDYAAHLALVNALGHIGDDATAVGRHFVGGTFPAPNSMFYLLTYPLSLVVGLDAAGRLIVALLIALTLWAFVNFLTTFGRSRWLGIAAVPVVIQWTFTEGFLDYYLGVALLLIALSAQHRYLLEPTRRRAIAVGTLGVLVFFAHVQALLFLAIGTLVLVGTHIVARRQGLSEWRMWTRRLIVIGAPVLVITAIWLLGQQSSLEGALTSAKTEWISADKKVGELTSKTLLVFADGPQGSLVLALILGLIATRRLLTALARPVDPNENMDVKTTTYAFVSRHFPLLFLVTCLFIFAIAPLNMGYYWNFHSRILPLAASVGVVAALPAIRPRREWRAAVAALPLVVVAGFAFAAWSTSLRKWDAYTDGFMEVLAKAPHEGYLFYIPEDKGNTGFTSQVWRHLNQYHTAFNDGTTTFSFGFQPGRIIRERDPKLVLEYGHVHQVPTLDSFGCFDVILHHGGTHLEEKYPDRARLIHRAGAWSVLAPLGQSCREAAAPGARGDDA